ncbi:hypothetical protein BLSTO_02185 [Blastocystis sp. subtype 1]
MKKCIAQICKKMGVEFISERALDTLCDVAITYIKQTGDKIVEEQGIPGKQPPQNEDVLSILLSSTQRKKRELFLLTRILENCKHDKPVMKFKYPIPIPLHPLYENSCNAVSLYTPLCGLTM